MNAIFVLVSKLCVEYTSCMVSSVSVCDERWPEVGAVCIVSILKVNCSKVWQPFSLPRQVPGCKLKQTGKRL